MGMKGAIKFKPSEGFLLLELVVLHAHHAFEVEKVGLLRKLAFIAIQFGRQRLRQWDVVLERLISEPGSEAC